MESKKILLIWKLDRLAWKPCAKNLSNKMTKFLGRIKFWSISWLNNSNNGIRKWNNCWFLLLWLEDLNNLLYLFLKNLEFWVWRMTQLLNSKRNFPCFRISWKMAMELRYSKRPFKECSKAQLWEKQSQILLVQRCLITIWRKAEVLLNHWDKIRIKVWFRLEIFLQMIQIICLRKLSFDFTFLLLYFIYFFQKNNRSKQKSFV